MLFSSFTFSLADHSFFFVCVFVVYCSFISTLDVCVCLCVWTVFWLLWHQWVGCWLFQPLQPKRQHRFWPWWFEYSRSGCCKCLSCGATPEWRAAVRKHGVQQQLIHSLLWLTTVDLVLAVRLGLEKVTWMWRRCVIHSLACRVFYDLWTCNTYLRLLTPALIYRRRKGLAARPCRTQAGAHFSNTWFFFLFVSAGWKMRQAVFRLQSGKSPLLCSIFLKGEISHNITLVYYFSQLWTVNTVFNLCLDWFELAASTHRLFTLFISYHILPPHLRKTCKVYRILCEHWLVCTHELVCQVFKKNFPH